MNTDNKPITFWCNSDTQKLLSIGMDITKLNRSKLIQLLIDSQLDSFIASFCTQDLEIEANSIKRRSKLNHSKGNTPTNTRFGISLKKTFIP